MYITQKAYQEEVVSFYIQVYFKKPKLKIINIQKTIKIIFRIPKSGNTYTYTLQFENIKQSYI